MCATLDLKSQWVHSTWIPENCHHAISAPLLGRPWRTLRLFWPLWWAVGPRSPADPARHPHYASLCRSQHRGLEDTAQEPGSAGPVGGEPLWGWRCRSCGQAQATMGRLLFLKQNMGGILAYTREKEWKRGRDREREGEMGGQSDTGSWVLYLLTGKHKKSDGQSLANS